MTALSMTGKLKARAPMYWAGLMNTCRTRAGKIILTELIHK